MRYAGIIENDFAAAPGVSTTFFVQGCPIHCKGCHNPESWSFDGGQEFENDTIGKVINALKDNNVKRNFCIMGGEPLCQDNLFLTQLMITEVKNAIPDIKIFIWSGYTWEELQAQLNNTHMKFIFDNVHCMITGPYREELRDVTLEMRGSSNQEIHYLT